ncbi:metal-sensitive transcriptional regulator [Rhabdothermincola salaria]|uniref:metal-sensitive transcriptional regulator n=1 Tax=Rhabdothermincola salaria TaxID=2903142 RepID=UPI001E62FEA7|nr:metal-sensitive transcriptional regulator [Rhabdothermincola salaria]MCD9623255.1 metal-sensitive transcriptional regulator [Rhabdothermincola salaria]
MDIPEDVIADVRTRLRRVAGQVQGVERMLEEGRECRDVVTQLSAATRALEQAGFRLVAAGLTYCVTEPEKAEADGYPLAEVEKMFMKLA